MAAEAQAHAAFARQPLVPPSAAARLYPHRYHSVHEPLQEEFIQVRYCYQLSTLLYITRAFLASLDWSAFFIMMSCVGATFICIHEKWISNEPITLTAAFLIFPMSFAIGFAADRRENFLLDTASLKASMICLFYIYRDYQPWLRHSERDYPTEFYSVIDVMIEDINVFIEHRGGKERLVRIYANLDYLSRFSDALRQEEDWVRSMWSRGYQYHRLLMQDFERMRVMHDFRTPTAVRALLMASNYLFPVFLTPLYAYYSKYGKWASIYNCVVTTFMLVSLLRIQMCVEDPFDGVGADDINLGMIKEVLKHIRDAKNGAEIPKTA